MLITISSKIVDELGSPISNATINEIGAYNSTLSDENGNFSLEILPWNKIQISHAAAPNPLILNSSLPSTITLPLINTIPEVVLGNVTNKKSIMIPVLIGLSFVFLISYANLSEKQKSIKADKKRYKTK